LREVSACQVNALATPGLGRERGAVGGGGSLGRGAQGPSLS
jgi:hypothetical protein